MAPRINIPPLTRGLLIGLIVLSLLNAGARYRKWDNSREASITSRIYHAPYLTIVPGSSWKFPWVFVSATLAEQNIFGLLVTGATLFYGGRYLERAWGSTEFVKFMALIAFVPNFLTYITYWAVILVTNDKNVAQTGISGGIAIQSAYLVAFKQLVPEHTVTFFRSLLRTRVKHFPAIFLAANTISGLALSTDTAMLLAWYGFLVSWVYLRFYRTSPALSSAGDTTIKGDASDTFAFSQFFPDAVEAPVAALSDAIYNVLVTMRVCTPFSAEEVEAGNEQALARGEGGLPSLLTPGGGHSSRSGGRREEAERRRALALRALDQRLQASTVKPAVSGGGSENILGSTDYRPDGESVPAPSNVGGGDMGNAGDGGTSEIKT